MLPYFCLPYLFLRLWPLVTQTPIVNTVFARLVLALVILGGVELYVKPHFVQNGQLNVDLESVMRQTHVTALELDSLVKIVPHVSFFSSEVHVTPKYFFSLFFPLFSYPSISRMQPCLRQQWNLCRCKFLLLRYWMGRSYLRRPCLQCPYRLRCW